MTYEYDLNNNKLKEIDRFGNAYTFEYDALNRLAQKKNPQGKVIERNFYDKDHKQVRSIDALGNGVAFAYDLDGRLTAESNRIPEAQLSEPIKMNWKLKTYTLDGKLVESQDQNQNKTKFQYDYLDRLVTVENALGEKSQYTYDLNNNLIAQTDGNANTTLMEYDAKNQMTKRIDPDGRTEKDGEAVYNPAFTMSWSYNPDGTVATKLDRNNNTMTYIYDGLGQVSKIQAKDDFIQTEYDTNGNVTRIANSSSDIIRQYDSENKNVQKTVSGFGTSSFEYDKPVDGSAGFSSEISTDVKGNELTKVQDQNGRLYQVKDGADVTQYTYRDNGSRASILYPGGIKEEYEYYSDNSLKQVTNKASNGSVIDSYNYTYDACGNMLSKVDAKGTTAYTYDALNRLKTVKEPSSKLVEYEYDAAGNRVRERISDGTNIVTKDYKYNKQNRLMEVTTNDLSANREDKQKFVYDNNGNQLYTLYEVTEKAVENSKAAFGMFISGQSYSGESAKTLFETNAVNTYNAFNQLIKTTGGDVEARYKYNGEGQRIEKIVVKNGNSKVTRYLRLGTDIAMEMDEKGDVLSKNVSGTALISREMGSNKYFLLYNGEGDVTAITDRAGTVVEKYYYDAFGNVLEQLDGAGQKIASGDSKNPLRYKGYEYDEETKRYYLGSRMYDPAIARFLQEDTYRGQLDDPLSLNLYAYCNNNPLVYDDPTGHAAKSTQAEKEKATAKITTQLEKNGKAWASASAKDKKTLHDSSNQLRADLVKCNEGNAVIKAYVDAGGTKKVEAVVGNKKIEVTPDSIKNTFYDEAKASRAIVVTTKEVKVTQTTQGTMISNNTSSSTGNTSKKINTREIAQETPVVQVIAATVNALSLIEKAKNNIKAGLQPLWDNNFTRGFDEAAMVRAAPEDTDKDSIEYKAGRFVGVAALGAQVATPLGEAKIAISAIKMTQASDLVLATDRVYETAAGSTQAASLMFKAATGQGSQAGTSGGKVPQKAIDVAEYISKNDGAPPKGYKGGRTFANDGRDGGKILPEGNYKEYDVNPYVKGQNRGAERLVIDKKGNVWYTNDHYKTFTKTK